MTRGDFGSIVFLVSAVVLYVLPAVIAGVRRHHQHGAITVINFLLGWTLLGWVIALAWACSAIPTQPPRP